MALGPEDGLVAIALDGVGRVALDLGKEEGLPVVESAEILAEEDLPVACRSGR